MTYCAVGYKSGALATKLREAGFTNVRNLEGSIFQWANRRRPLVREDQPVTTVHPYSSLWGRLLIDEVRAPLGKKKKKKKKKNKCRGALKIRPGWLVRRLAQAPLHSRGGGGGGGEREKKRADCSRRHKGRRSSPDGKYARAPSIGPANAGRDPRE